MLTSVLVAWRAALACARACLQVDTFFAIGGFLVALLTLRTLKKEGSVNWALFILHRWLRLTPLYGVVILIFTWIVPLLGEGPLWHIGQQAPEPCFDKWWQNILYISNFWSMSKMCVGWAWYLSNQFQFDVILAPILIVILHKWPRAGVAFALSLLVGSMVAVGIVAWDNELLANGFVG